MDLCVWESEEHERGVGAGVNATLPSETYSQQNLPEGQMKLFIIKQDLYMSVDVMKDYKLKRRNLHVSHTLGCSGDWNT